MQDKISAQIEEHLAELPAQMRRHTAPTDSLNCVRDSGQSCVGGVHGHLREDLLNCLKLHYPINTSGLLLGGLPSQRNSGYERRFIHGENGKGFRWKCHTRDWSSDSDYQPLAVIVARYNFDADVVGILRRVLAIRCRYPFNVEQMDLPPKLNLRDPFRELTHSLIH